MTDLCEDNILIKYLPKFNSIETASQALTYLPPISNINKNTSISNCSQNILTLRQLHLPSKIGVNLLFKIDAVLLNSYIQRNPNKTKVWSSIFGQNYMQHTLPIPPVLVISVTGHAGVGKSAAIRHALSTYKQIISHSQFPNIIGAHTQVTWISVDVPSSGKSEDLARSLMQAWHDAYEKYEPGHSKRFEDVLSGRRKDGIRLLDDWLQVAKSHFLGILHLDEVQNFFKLMTLAQRRKINTDDSFELSIAEDKCLKWILNLINSGEIPLIFSGTQDGINAFNKRFSTSQRISGIGGFEITPFKSSNDPEYRQILLPLLLKYQYLPDKIQLTDELADLLIELTGGIRRILISLWMATQLEALLNGERKLTIQHFKKVFNKDFGELRPAINALKSNRPRELRKFDDMMKNFNY
ncbi:MAG: ATP-binding protein [Methylophilus sp.]|nr:ATP-binding protein [Methylophilus sp.]